MSRLWHKERGLDASIDHLVILFESRPFVQLFEQGWIKIYGWGMVGLHSMRRADSEENQDKGDG
jgi:hypothetical protein